jgi:predicted  nucleic acid-binding Zn-ribbon protein
MENIYETQKDLAEVKEQQKNLDLQFDTVRQELIVLRKEYKDLAVKNETMSNDLSISKKAVKDGGGMLFYGEKDFPAVEEKIRQNEARQDAIKGQSKDKGKQLTTLAEKLQSLNKKVGTLKAKIMEEYEAWLLPQKRKEAIQELGKGMTNLNSLIENTRREYCS